MCVNFKDTYAKWNTSVTKGLYNSIDMKYLEKSNSETESGMMVARGRREEDIGSCLMGIVGRGYRELRV